MINRIIDKYFFHIIMLLAVFAVIIVTTKITGQMGTMRDRIGSLETQLAEQKLEFETFKQLTNDEFVSTWKSFATMRNNFQALGHGYHLEKEDFAPEDENDTNGTSDSSDGKMQ